MTQIKIIRVSILVLFSISCCDSRDNGTLKAVVVVFRHGDRTIIKSYPNDPYKDISFWPGGYGQLTNLGKEQHYRLGQWFRKRYSDFLPSTYSLYDIRVQSTDVDRALMSAAAHLAGLYPPSENQIWDSKLLWQPIPIHTVPAQNDAILHMGKPCKRREELRNKLHDSEEIQYYKREAKSLSEYITYHSGHNISSIENLSSIYSTLHIEESAGYQLPDWTRAVYPHALLKYAVLKFKLSCYNKPLARLQAGPFLNALVSNFRNVTRHLDASYQKYKIYSAHDSTIANILMAMGAFNDAVPPFASALIFEFRKTSDRYFINLLYKNSTNEPYEMQVQGCEFNCDFEDFVKILKPVTVDPDTWEKECSVVPSEIHGGSYEDDQKCSLKNKLLMQIMRYIISVSRNDFFKTKK